MPPTALRKGRGVEWLTLVIVVNRNIKTINKQINVFLLPKYIHPLLFGRGIGGEAYIL